MSSASVATAKNPQSSDIQPKPMTETDCSLWNDPRWARARQSMGKEAEEHYATIGEQFNGSIDYTNGNSNSIPIPALDSIAYVTVGVRSGLTLEDLTEDEIKLMDEFVGGNWYEKILTGDKIFE